MAGITQNKQNVLFSLWSLNVGKVLIRSDHGLKAMIRSKEKNTVVVLTIMKIINNKVIINILLLIIFLITIIFPKNLRSVS